MTQNRIFKFNIEKEDDKRSKSRSRARRSIDMDNEDDYSGYPLSANELIQGRNLFDEVQNKAALRVVATMLWDSKLANAVLEELLHNARFSMYGIHAKNIADQLRKEMNLGNAPSYDNESTPAIDENQEQDKYPQQQQQKQQYQRQNNQNNQQTKDITHGNYDQVGNNNVAQFELPPPTRPVAMATAKQNSKNQYSGYNDADSPQSQPKREFRGFVNNNNGDSYASNPNQQYNSYNRPNSNSASKPTQSMKQNQATSKYNNNNNNTKYNQGGYEPQSDHARYEQLKKEAAQQHNYSTPEPISSIPEESADLPSDSPEKKHKGHSASVVFHDNIRDSEIMDDGANQYDSDAGYEHDDDSDDNMPHKFSD